MTGADLSAALRDGDATTRLPLGRAAFALGGSIVVAAAGAFAAGALGLALGIGVGAWLVLPMLLAQAAFAFASWRAVGTDRPVVRAIATVAAGWLVFVAAAAVSARIDDTSTDGRHYQGESIRALADGWNPVRDDPLVWPPGNPAIWTNAYPKAAWVLEAAAMRATDFETAKALAPVLVVASALLAYAGLAALGLGTAGAVAGAVALALNPVAAAQVTSHMVDGIRASLMLSAVMAGLLIVRRPGRAPPLVVFVAALVLIVNVKFTGLALGGLIIVVTLGAGVVRGGWRGERLRAGVRAMRRPLVTVAIALVVAVPILGFNPYVTNSVRHGSPLHPVVGPEAIDVTEVHTGRALRGMSDLERLLRSVVGRTHASGVYADAKLPFTVDADEWRAFRHPNVRIGGFGPLFSGVLLVALVTAASLLVARVRHRGSPGPDGAYLLTMAAAFALSVAVLPNAFLARFAPQLWFVPLLVLVVCLQTTVPRVVRVLAWFGLLVALVNALGVGLTGGRLDVRDSRRQDANLARLAAAPAGYDAQFRRWVRPEARRLLDAGVRFRPVERVTCAVPLGLRFDGDLVRVDRDRRKGRGFRGVLLCPAAPSVAQAGSSPGDQ
jgi:hypothetical protein